MWIVLPLIFTAAVKSASSSPSWSTDGGASAAASVYIPPEPSASRPPGYSRTSTTKPPPSPYTSLTKSSTKTSPSPYPYPTKSSSLPACASVSKLAASFTKASPSATPTVPAQLAYDCINSIPFNQSAAAAFLDSIRPYINWQTTIEYLKSPPADYAQKVQPPYDFWANFNRIYSNVRAGSYKNEYSFGFDLYRSFQMAHDGHFVMYPDSVNEIFSYGRTTPLVSVSLDGTTIPQVYVYGDIVQKVAGNAKFTPSPLTKINGQNSTQFLLDFSEYGSLQDPDALWNNVFYGLAQVSLGPGGTGAGTFAGGGRGRWIFPGPTTTLTFANGTSVTNPNFARVLVPFDNITTGEDIYRTYFIPPPGAVQPAAVIATQTTPAPATTSSSASTTSKATTSKASTSIPAPGYPSPVVREMNNLNSGYFLTGADYDDVAVLSVPSFVGSSADEIPFQDVNSELIAKAVAANKTKLIIDVSANGGGTILQGYDLFKQLFPHILPFGGNRFRAHEALDYIGQEASYFAGLVPRSLSDNDTTLDVISQPYNYRTDADVDYRPFTSWAQKYGPHAYGPQPDNFTTLQRWNLSDVLTPINSGGIYVSGYLNRSNVTTQPFKAANIVIVYDGYCASTCTIFSELMTAQAGVRTIALGGRPNKNIIQAVGGVKGVNDLLFGDVLDSVLIPFTYHHYHSAKFYNTTALGAYSSLPLYRSVAAVVNARDGLRQGDASQLPLQFVYQPADCRIYYTPEMVVDETAVWKTVADTAFRGINHCVAGALPKPPGSYPSRKLKSREGFVRKHAARKGIDLEAHLQSLTSVWTGKGGVRFGGDGFMIP